MPRMTTLIDPTDETTQFTLPGGTYQFSAARPDQLGASEYTLVTIVVDETSSVSPFADDLLAAVTGIVQACRQAPRSDNLMIRLVAFNERQREIHGFKPLNMIRESDYPPFRPSGMTALYDAVHAGVSATAIYGGQLSRKGFTVNGAVYVITDGMDNQSTGTPAMIGDRITDIEKGDDLDSLVTVLVGLVPKGRDENGGVAKALRDFQQAARLSQYVNVAGATPSNLARLARFVSQSISLHSQALGSGRAARSLSF